MKIKREYKELKEIKKLNAPTLKAIEQLESKLNEYYLLFNASVKSIELMAMELDKLDLDEDEDEIYRLEGYIESLEIQMQSIKRQVEPIENNIEMFKSGKVEVTGSAE